VLSRGSVRLVILAVLKHCYKPCADIYSNMSLTNGDSDFYYFCVPLSFCITKSVLTLYSCNQESCSQLFIPITPANLLSGYGPSSVDLYGIKII